MAADVGPTRRLAHGGHSRRVAAVTSGGDGLVVGGWWWEERVLCLCLVMGVKIIAKQTNTKQTVIKQTT